MPSEGRESIECEVAEEAEAEQEESKDSLHESNFGTSRDKKVAGVLGFLKKETQNRDGVYVKASGNLEDPHNSPSLKLDHLGRNTTKTPKK